MKIREVLMEAAQQQGAFKALFIAGPPGSGKTTLLNSMKGSLPPNFVHLTLDRYIEQLNVDKPSGQQRLAAKVDVSETLSDAVNHTLPVVIDTTGNDEQRLLARKSTMEAVGYDVAMVWIDVNYETSLRRVAQRERTQKRKVARDVILAVHEQKHHLLARYQQQFGRHAFYYANAEKSNAIDGVRGFINSFFNHTVTNQKGQELMKRMKETGAETLYPDVLDVHDLKYIPQRWYTRWEVKDK